MRAVRVAGASGPLAHSPRECQQETYTGVSTQATRVPRAGEPTSPTQCGTNRPGRRSVALQRSMRATLPSSRDETATRGSCGRGAATRGRRPGHSRAARRRPRCSGDLHPPALLTVPAPEAAPCSVYSGRTVHLPELRGMRADGVGRFRSRVRPQRCRALSGPSTVGPQHRQGVRRRHLPCRSGAPPGHRTWACAMTASPQVWGTSSPDDAESAGRGLVDATDPQQGRHLRKRDLGGPRRRGRPVRTSRRDRRSVGCNVAGTGRGTTRCPDLDESVPHCSPGELRFGAGIRLAPTISTPDRLSTVDE